MFTVDRNGCLPGDCQEMITRLEQLTRDLKALAGGDAPDPDILAAAPFIDRYRLGLRQVPCLIGEATGHPRLPGTAREIISSDLYVIAPCQGWARTLSRYYRLGRSGVRDHGRLS